MFPPPVTVGIGASAGGVEALRSFFGAAEPDCGLAFVVDLHFPPQATSHLVGILGQCTTLPVTTALHGETIEADHVYVVPPGVVATVDSGSFDLAALDDARNPIDQLFCSLAGEFGERAVGVVLSGTGSDGSRGIEAISAEGGLTLAQGDGGGGHPEMPASAIATGRVDQVLQVEEMPAHLAAYGKTLLSGDGAHAAPHHFQKVKDDLCALLLTGARHDFSRYKESTFLRRVERRMQVLKIDDWAAYVEQARQDPDEVMRLFHDLLIGVTAFFRDEDAFRALATTVIPRLFAGKGPLDKVRVWVPGCASGEEAYTLAILLCEHAEAHPASAQIEIFATDVDEAALRTARLGRYPASALEGMPGDRIGRFFARDGDTVIATKPLRTLCTFALHSIIRDPPLCAMDLVSCRNVLIYFDRHLQNQVVPTFHFALRPGGILFLGTSENVGQHSELFAAENKANRIFKRLESPRHSIPFLPPSKRLPAPRRGLALGGKPELARTIAQSAEAQVLACYGPANVVVNGGGDIVHFSPRTGKYLEPIAGTPNQKNLLAMARKGLRISLRSALHEAKTSGQVAVRDNIAVGLDATAEQKVRIAVRPLEHEGAENPLWLVTFEDIGNISPTAKVALMDGATATEMGIQQLELELLDTRGNLQAAIDEYEIAVEELRSSNEELMSLNDDLQATNEELEASKEELHVVNDELRTVNSELAAKIEELKLANGDLRNLFESTGIAVVFLGRDLVIRSFTPAVAETFQIKPTDCGRLFTDIVSLLDCDGLTADVAAAMATGEASERAVIRRDGSAHYLLRIIPYLTLEGTMDGVLITLVNISAAVEARAQERYQRLLIGELNHRVKNILTVAVSLATQTLRDTTDAAEFVSSFIGRLQALAKAHELLCNENWADVPLRDLITGALQLQGEDPGRVTLDGPLLRLAPKAATTLSLAIHELTTNAIKYGALANDTGRLDIGWAKELRPEGAFLTIRWRERGGPPVVPPNRKGFGSELIERGIRYELRGTAKVDYLPTGVEVTISLPLGDPSSPAPIPDGEDGP